MPDSVVYIDSYHSYNALAVAGFIHHRINHTHEFAVVLSGIATQDINGIENLWNQAKRALWKHNGIPADRFRLFLKECEFRFNYGTPKEQL